MRRQEKVEDLKSSIPQLGKEHQADKVRCVLPMEEYFDAIETKVYANS